MARRIKLSGRSFVCRAKRVRTRWRGKRSLHAYCKKVKKGRRK